MGQKVNPIAFRLGILYQAKSRWFNDKKNYRLFLRQDVQIRDWIKEKLKTARVSHVNIERSGNTMKIHIHTSRPGVIIGRGGSALEDLKKGVKKLVDPKINIDLNIIEVKKPDLEADLVMQNIVEQLEKRIPFRKAMKRAIGQVMAAGGLGVKVMVSGRLNGAEIARTEMLAEGKIPLHTLRADIDYANDVAHTTYGTIGVKTWIYKGDIFEKNQNTTPTEEKPSTERSRKSRYQKR